jgi:hypothetical protein
MEERRWQKKKKKVLKKHKQNLSKSKGRHELICKEDQQIPRRINSKRPIRGHTLENY